MFVVEATCVRLFTVPWIGDPFQLGYGARQFPPQSFKEQVCVRCPFFDATIASSGITVILECAGDGQEGEYEVAYFPVGMKVMG
jgi:hypothetical protein